MTAKKTKTNRKYKRQGLEKDKQQAGLQVVGGRGVGSSGSDPSASELHGSAASAYTQTFSNFIIIFRYGSI